MLLKQCKGLSKCQLLPQGQGQCSLPHFAVRSIPEGISVQIHRKVTKVPTGVVYHLLPTLPTSPLGEMTFAKETVGKQFGFSLTLPCKPPAILHPEGGTFISSAVFSAKQKALGPDGKIFPVGIIQISTVFQRHFPAAYSPRQLFQAPVGFVSMGRWLL